MKELLILIMSMVLQTLTIAQPPSSTQVQARLPKGTIIHGNISYNNDTLKKHLLDIYVPAGAKGKVPLVVFIHGGGWIGNDKYADMGYMPNTIAAMLNNGMAVASIDYRFAPRRCFLQFCKTAIRRFHFYSTMPINIV